jgi:serine/threonine protein kinase
MTSQDVDVDTAPLRVVAEPEPGGWVLAGRYRVLGRIGQGGVAEVFKARDRHLGREVAVKVFRSDVDAGVGAERHDVELQALARLSHPNLVTLFDAAVGEGVEPEFLVMELVDGVTLARALVDGPLEEEQVRELGVQVASALAYVHSAGVVHRDVKPGNILLGTDGSGGLRARLSDFGIARFIGGEHLTGVGFTVGTAAYLAPEQVRGADVGPAADVYALGLVLLEALTGDRCFDGPPSEAAVARLATGPRIPKTLPEPWPDLLTAMTAADPPARPSAAAVARSLGIRTPPAELSFVDPEPVAAIEPATSTAELPVVADVEPEFPRGRTGLASLVVASLVALVVLGIVGYALALSHGSPRTPSVPPASQHSRLHPASHLSSSRPSSPAARVVVTQERRRPHASSTHSTPPRSARRSASVPATSPASTAPASTPANSTVSTPTSTPPPSPSASPSSTPSTSPPT